jgi:hypothetical protein
MESGSTPRAAPLDNLEDLVYSALDCLEESGRCRRNLSKAISGTILAN